VVTALEGPDNHRMAVNPLRGWICSGDFFLRRSYSRYCPSGKPEAKAANRI